MSDLNLITDSLPASDPRAKQELEDLLSKSKRDKREIDSQHWAFVILLWILVLGFASVVVIYILHIVLPVRYCWLDEAHLSKLTQFLTTGGIGGVGTALFKNKFEKK